MLDSGVRKALKAAAFVLYNAVIVCAIFATLEFSARWYVSAKRGRGREQAEEIIDRWSAFRTTSNFDRLGVHHNSQGFRRDTDVALAKPPGTKRIFVLGGSVAYGAETVYPEIDSRWKITNHETIDYFLQQRLTAAFPSTHWEVINAAVSGFQLHEDLARILSVLLRYQPDAVILLDGVNDLSELIRSGPDFDAYAQTALAAQFNDLTDPRGLPALETMLSTWLVRNSVLFRAIHDRAEHRAHLGYRRQRIAGRVAPGLRLADLSPSEEQRYLVIASQIGYYKHVVQQIHRILSVDAIDDLFVLQPTLRLSRKPLTEVETRLAEYDRSVAGKLEMYAYESLYPVMAAQLSEESRRERFHFLNLTGVFDPLTVQTFTDYCHLTPDGNRAIAEAIFESAGPWLRERPH
jgi:lysophospholipase L1-like esterase